VNVNGKQCANVCVHTGGVLCRFHVNQQAGKREATAFPIGPVKAEPEEAELGAGPSLSVNIVGGEVVLSGDEAAIEAEEEEEEEEEEGGHEGEGEFFREDILPPHVATAPNKRKVTALTPPGSPPQRQPKQPRSTDSGDEGAWSGLPPKPKVCPY